MRRPKAVSANMGLGEQDEMPNHGIHIAKKTGIVAEIRSIVINGDETYMCKIGEKIYKMTKIEFEQKWKPYRPVKTDVKQGIIEAVNALDEELNRRTDD